MLSRLPCTRNCKLAQGGFAGGPAQVLCTTSTLAQGVNLPAHLVVLKGTRRWSRENGEAAGHKEYDRSSVLQMIGRAGRPQFDTEGVAVIMTQKEVRASCKRSPSTCSQLT